MLYGDRALRYLIVFSCLSNIYSTSVLAQVTPDNTLGNEKSIVIPNATIKNIPADLIEGGAIRDSNLFHSFTEFNIPNGNHVYFANPKGIDNILSRVTGNNISEIFGTLGVDGTANLFLLNPNGIVFGENASLDVNGSFLATTADSYIFDNGLEYSASSPEAASLLTINIPLGIQFGTKAESITNFSQAVDPTTNNTVGLQVPLEQSLTLLGGDIILDGGNLSTTGKIELGSVAPKSLVNLGIDRGIILDYEAVPDFQDIYLRNLAKVSAEDDIQVQGRQIILTEGSQINSNVTDGSNGGLLTVIASEKLELSGVGENNISSSLQNNNLQSENINDNDGISVKAPRLVLENGAEIVSSANNSGDGGNIKIEAQEIAITGVSDSFTPTVIGLRSFGKGKAGNLQIATQSLLLDTGLLSSVPLGEGNGGNVEVEADEISIINGGQIQSGALFGSGEGGDLIVKTKTINISGVTPFNINPATNRPTTEEGGKALSGLFSSVNARSTGNAGNIFLETDDLSISDGGIIGSNTDSTGNAGNIAIKAKDIEVRDVFVAFNGALSGIRTTIEEGAVGTGGDITIDSESLRVLAGGQINASTLGDGDAGDITLNVQDLQINGISETKNSASSITALSDNNFAAGSIDIDANNIDIKDRGNISVSNLNDGDSGNLNITTTELNLDDSAIIEAKVNTGNRGNINLTSKNIFLNNESEITVQATGKATGGNIKINNQDNIVLLNNSQIIANAREGNGGRIDLTTQGLFIDFSSKIDASSEFGVDGVVKVETIDSDRILELGILTAKPINAAEKITTGCNSGSDFVIAGKGGLPQNPNKYLRGEAIWQDLRLVEMNSQTFLKNDLQIEKISSEPIVEAQGWKTNNFGKIELINHKSNNFTRNDYVDCRFFHT